MSQLSSLSLPSLAWNTAGVMLCQPQHQAQLKGAPIWKLEAAASAARVGRGIRRSPWDRAEEP